LGVRATGAGFDRDEDSIAAACRNAHDAGVSDRVRFSVSDAAHSATAQEYDLVTIFEALHDMSRPVAALVMRPSTLRRYATAAGFSEIDVLAIATGPFRFYRLMS
jgi:tRNA A58 N-methylase Trm61